MELKDASDHHKVSVSNASDCGISESTEPTKTATPSGQMALVERMESNVPNLTVTENSLTYPTLNNTESQNTQETNASESCLPEGPTASSGQLPFSDNMEAKNASESNLTGNATSPSELLPLLDRMDFKDQINPFLTGLSTSEPNMTGPEASDSKGALDQDTSNPNLTEPYTPPSNMAKPTAPDSTIPDSTEQLVGEGFRMRDESIERHRQYRQRKAREREYRILGGKIGCNLSDQEIREILRRPPSERNEQGYIINMDYVFQWVPREHQELPIADNKAQCIIHRATQKAVRRRLRQANESIKEWSSVHTDDNCFFNLIAHWYGERPELPESLKDVPTIWLSNLERSDEQRRQIHQWIQDRNDQRRQYRTMAQALGDKIGDEQLLDIIRILPSEWNEHGDIIGMDHVFQSLPLENEGPIDNKSVVDIIRAAIDIALYKRLSQIDSNHSYDDGLTKNAYSSITAHWSSIKPELPDSLKDVSALIVFDELSTDPDDFRYDFGSRRRVGEPHIRPSQDNI